MLAPAHAFSAGRSRTEATDAPPQLPADLGRSGEIWVLLKTTGPELQNPCLFSFAGLWFSLHVLQLTKLSGFLFNVPYSYCSVF